MSWRPKPGQPLPADRTQQCRVCGCTEDDCSECVAATGSPCSWVEPDLCSACRGQERPLGPIERELRGNYELLTGGATGAYRVWAGARAELRRRGMKRPAPIDVASEAIEAAEALGL